MTLSSPKSSNLSLSSSEPLTGTFDYFAYGSCMCPVDLQRSLGEPVYPYVLGVGCLPNYQLAFNRRSQKRSCGVLDIVSKPDAVTFGVVYRLPNRFSQALDEREEVPHQGYRRETVQVNCQPHGLLSTRTYVVNDKLTAELAPNDWYMNIVLRGAVTCGLPEQYCWQIFEHMTRLQRQEQRSAAVFSHSR